MIARGRLPKMLRRRETERRRVETFVAVMRRSIEPEPEPATQPIPLPRVELVDTPHGPRWQLDGPSRALLGRRTDTAELPRIVARASAPLR